ncbi:MAG: SMC-Scp complex subunit ScpB [Myxococcales bacterium]
MKKRKNGQRKGDDAPDTTAQDPEITAEILSEVVPELAPELALLDDQGDTAADLDAAVSVEGAAEQEAAAVAAETTAVAGDDDGAALDAAEGPTEGLAEGAEPLPEVEGSRLESIIESLLFAADRPLVVNELKRLLGERDGKRVSEALESVRLRHAESGIQLVSVAGGWQLRTHPGNGAWVAKLVAGRPTRLSRAMMETLAIVAYRQPITRPEIDEIRGVDCGPVLRTLLDRALIRVIGKKEEVGRPILYGTTPDFLKIFSLRDLADLPTLREFHELGADDRARVDATTGVDNTAFADGTAAGIPAPESLRAGELPEVDPEEEDSLIEALEHATHAAGRAERSLVQPEADATEGDGPDASASSAHGDPSAAADTNVQRQDVHQDDR